MDPARPAGGDGERGQHGDGHEEGGGVQEGAARRPALVGGVGRRLRLPLVEEEAELAVGVEVGLAVARLSGTVTTLGTGPHHHRADRSEDAHRLGYRRVPGPP
jgi:hypothetical protein